MIGWTIAAAAFPVGFTAFNLLFECFVRWYLHHLEARHAR